MQNRFKNSGVLLSWHIDGKRLCLSYERAKAFVELLSLGAARVQIVPTGDAFQEQSYAIPEPPHLRDMAVEENPEYLSCRHEAFEVRIAKAAFYVDFFDWEEQAILCDERGLGVQFLGTQTHQFKQRRKGEKFTGLGSKTGPLNKTGKHYTCWNTDSFGFWTDTDPLYASIPFYIGLFEDKPYGIFLNNSSKTHFDFGASNYRYSSFVMESGALDYYFFYTGDVQGIVAQYSRLSGLSPMPPKWSLGFQQCRYSYYPQKEVLRIAREFREREIPADVMYLDIHYMDKYKVFTWHPDFFPEPKQMLEELKALDFKTVVILDPGIKVEEGYEVHDSGLEMDVFVKYLDGALMEGDVWPGKCYFPDFTQEECRKWWAAYVADWRKQGIEGFWTDMNEPAVWGKQFPDVTLFDMDGQGGTHLEAHNVYGMQMSRATNEGIKAAKAEERVFQLTRAAYPGSQRYTAIWTGDNVSEPAHVPLSARMIASISMAGMPFCGADVGGFVGECSADVFKAWIAVGAFQPLFRSHTMINSRAAEPWSFGEETMEIAANYIRLRYKLLPYWYALFYAYSRSAIPPVRPLLMSHPFESNAWSEAFDSQFYLGDGMLVCPYEPGKEYQKIWLPEAQRWFALYNDQVWEGGKEYILPVEKDLLPVFIAEGSILPMESKIPQHTGDSSDTLEWHIYGLGQSAHFHWYEDDGIHTDGDSLSRIVSIDSCEKNVKFSEVCGDYISPYKKYRIYLHGLENQINIEVNGSKSKLEKADFRFVKPLSNFDPYESENADIKIIFGLPFLEIEAQNIEIIIKFISD